MGSNYQQQLQPSLLDRLTDDDPKNPKESAEQRVMGMRRLRQAVLRDLVWLLNTTNLAAGESLDEFPEIASSVLNYGFSETSGHLIAGMDIALLERLLRKAIQDFEPRILPHSVRVRAFDDKNGGQHNQLMFEIEGKLWAEPTPAHLLVRTQFDLEEGKVRVTDAFGSGIG